MIDQRRPFDLPSPITVVTGLCLKPSAGSNSTVDYRALSTTAQQWMACLQIDQVAIERLFQLWNAILELEADEISDWSLQAQCTIAAPKDGSVPPILGIAATVYANGEVSCAITVEGVDPPLNFVEVFDLSEFDTSAPAVTNMPGASA